MVIEPIEDKIRELCARLAAADSPELPEVVAELRTVLKTLRMIEAFPRSKSEAAD